MKTRIIIIICVCMSLASIQSSFASQKQLRHRGFAGFSYRAVTKADMDSLKLSDMNGIVVRQVFPDTPAARAGLQVGDIIKKYDENVIMDESQFISVTRSYYAGDRVNVSLLRDGKPALVNLILEGFPEETSDEVETEYTSFPNKDILLRAVVISPLNSGGKKLPALLIVSALNSPRLIGVPSYLMHREMAYAVAKRGFRVMRFELRGFGDSEGEDYRLTDFTTEVNDNLAAFAYLMNRDDVDKDNVFVFGHSTGGMIAAILASKRETAGLITSCTIGRTFYERMVETVRLQAQLADESGIDIDKKIKEYLNLTVSVARGDLLSKILERNPELSRFVNKSNRIMDDRTVEYWHQQLNFNLSEIYSEIKEPVLIVYAASDFLTQLECHEHIRDVLISSGNPDVTLTVVPDLDHAYAYAKDKKESFENYKTRNFKGNPEATRQTIEWMLKHTNKTKPNAKKSMGEGG